MKLIITTPTSLVVAGVDISSLRAEDESGSFGILRRHAEFLTALVPTVVTWRDAKGAERYCAVRGGVLRVESGDISIATREAVPGDDLVILENEVLLHFHEAIAVEKEAKVAMEKLHLAALRRILTYLRPERGAGDFANTGMG